MEKRAVVNSDKEKLAHDAASRPVAPNKKKQKNKEKEQHDRTRRDPANREH